MVDHHYLWAALEVDDFGNEGRIDAFCAALTGRGLWPVIWETSPMPQLHRWSHLGVRGYVAEIESEGDYIAVASGPVPDVPHAVVTNFNGLGPNPSRSKLLLDKSYSCGVEVYPETNDWPHMEDYAHRVLGWPFEKIFPIYGIYRGRTLADYDTSIYHAVYPAEYAYATATA